MLQPIQTSLKPREAVQTILKNIESKRVREVLEKRFGLKSGKRETLEAIGKEYGITRERVRQIEADGLRVVAAPAVYSMADLVFQALEEHLKVHGGVAAEDHLLKSVADEKETPHVRFLLTVGKQFHKKPETEKVRDTWAVSHDSHRMAEKILENVYRDLDAKKTPVSRSVLMDLFAVHAEKVLGERPKEAVLTNLLGMAKQIAENPFGEYGLVSWSTIRPKGVRDKVYLVLQKAAKPMHFRDVARAINEMKWTKRPAHPQTVHNELIKTGSRFVLVGRGLYALREWGYTPGTVAEVMKTVLKEAGKPLPREEIIRRVLDKRFVKENTILLNLQNKSQFSRQSDGSYFLV